ncbi:acyl-CoA dehydrogenase family protein [Truepera radiovictrix]|uniref:acyl-CoA dehydrogenase family protein n=1 Tax=Truepera radiovictrix TaxID=332249 RepID=UPI0005A54EBC
MDDFYGLEPLYTAEERRLRDTMRAFVAAEILPHIGDWWQREHFPPHLPRALGELGLLGVSLPKAYGGQGASHTAYGLVCQALEYGDSGLRSFLSVQSSLVMYPLYKYASETLQKRWLPPLATGEAVGCFALTEPHGGSDPSRMKVTARRVGGEYVLSGHKRWSTNGLIADLAIVWAKEEGSDQVVGFAVETRSEGFEARGIPGRASLRASVSSEVFLHEVRVPAENKLAVEGLRGPLSCLNAARFGIAFGALGAGYACFDEARRYVAERELFGESLAHKQLVQAGLADMLAELTKGSLLAYHLGRLKEAGQDTPARVSLAKRDNVRAAQRVARTARDLLGGNGILTEHASIRHLLNLESVATYEGTDAVHTLVLGREITGHNAF